ncbi:MAG TPA: hypothetical protein VF874_18220, partial [Mycobacterium sp.]
GAFIHWVSADGHGVVSQDFRDLAAVGRTRRDAAQLARVLCTCAARRDLNTRNSYSHRVTAAWVAKGHR